MRPPDAPASKLISLGDISAAIRRSKRIWSIAAVVGLAPRMRAVRQLQGRLSGSVSILITNDPSQDPVTQQATNQLLAQAPTLGAQMVQKLGLDETPTAFLKTYTVTVTSNQVLADRDQRAIVQLATSRAKALASEFLQYRAETLQDQQSTIFTAENQQLTQEEQTVSSLNKQISQLVRIGRATARTSLRALQAKQGKATAMVAALQADGGRRARRQSGSRPRRMISGSSILSMSPAAPVNSPKKTLLEYVLGGLLGGLVVGMGWVAVRAIVSDRLRRRSDIAEALGAPVRISVPTAGTGGKSLASDAPRPERGTGRRDRPCRRYLRNALPGNARGPATLAVVAVDNAKAVASIVVALATACALKAKRVLVADLSGGVLAGQLGESKPGVHTRDGE